MVFHVVSVTAFVRQVNKEMRDALIAVIPKVVVCHHVVDFFGNFHLRISNRGNQRGYGIVFGVMIEYLYVGKLSF